MPRNSPTNVSSSPSMAHRFGGLACACAIALAAVADVQAKPQVLEPKPIPSPDGRHLANVEWESLGFVGILRMNVFGKSGTLEHSIEVPEINPEPASLTWIDNDWVACESFLGDHGSGFFYVDVRSARGYLVEIVAPGKDAPWVFTVSTNDRESSMSVGNISRGRSSLFPILLRDAPQREIDYFTSEFCRKFSAAADATLDWIRASGIRELLILGDASLRPDTGGLTVARINGRVELVYFRTGAPTPAEMLKSVRRQPLSEEAQEILLRDGAPEPHARWVDETRFVVEGYVADGNLATTGTMTAVLMQGRFEGVSDTPVAISADTAPDKPGHGRTTKQGKPSEPSDESPEDGKEESGKSDRTANKSGIRIEDAGSAGKTNKKPTPKPSTKSAKKKPSPSR